MRKFGVMFSATLVILVFLGTSGCDKKIVVGSAGVQDLLKIIPEKASGIFVMNLQGITRLDLFKEQMEKVKSGEMDAENDFFEKYTEFVDQTGLDPEKDFKSMVVAMFGPPEMGMHSEGNFAAVMHLNYDESRIVKYIKEKNPNHSTEEYGDRMIYTMTLDEGKEVSLAFLNEHAIAMGRTASLKSVIDLEQKGGKNITDNPGFKPFLGELQKDKLVSFVMDVPEKMKEPQPEGTPFKVDLSKAEIMHGFIGYAGNVWSGEMILISKDEEANKQVVNLLNGLKGMAALAGPEVAELVGDINLSASADNIKLTFSISDELLKKLQTKIKEKSLGGPPPVQPE